MELEKENEKIKNKNSEHEAENKRYIAIIVATDDEKKITKFQVIIDKKIFFIKYIIFINLIAIVRQESRHHRQK